MRKKAYLVGAVVIILAMFLVSTGSALAAPREDNPGKDPARFQKTVFVHYPNGEPAKGGVPGAPGVKNNSTDKEWYKYSGVHWDNPEITYIVQSTVSQPFLDGIKNAFQVWEDDDASYINFEYDTATFSGVPSSLIDDGIMNGDNEVGWADISTLYPNAIAVTFVWSNTFTGIIAEVDMAMNSSLPWSQTNPDPGVDPDIVTGNLNSYDVQNIATHEVGHWLMLGDLYNKPAGDQTMYGIGARGELKKRSLESGDLAGLRLIYGTN